MEEEKKKKSNVLINTVIVIFLVIVCVFIYAKYVGTSGVRVKEYRISSENIPSNFSGVKIVYFSDFLYAGIDGLEMIKASVEKINLLKPDIVLFGGGLISKGYKLSADEVGNISEELNKIDANLGKYSVSGVYDDSEVTKIYTNSNFILLENKEENIYINENTPICLVGVSSYVKGAYNLETSFEFKSSNPTCYTILFTHEGDILDKVKDNINKPDVIFAGNSLGGEIRVPFYGGLFRNEGSMSYYEDIYQIDGINVYISSGFGTLETGMRLNNRPSFNFFRLKSLYKN